MGVVQLISVGKFNLQSSGGALHLCIRNKKILRIQNGAVITLSLTQIAEENVLFFPLLKLQ